MLPIERWVRSGPFDNSWYCLRSTGKLNTLAASKARWVSPLQRHTPSMIDVGSIQGLLDHDYELHA